MTLLNRIQQGPNANGGNTVSQNQNQNQNTNTPPPAPANNNAPLSRFGNNQQAPARKPPTHLQLENTLVPLQRVMVRFSLHGLGDPFYRLLGHPINTDYAELSTLTKALESGGEAVDALHEKLSQDWERYALEGAMLIFNHNSETAEHLGSPLPMPNNKPDRRRRDDDENDEEDVFAARRTRNPDTTFLRALDLSLTLNVLGRARSQILIAHAPLVFGTRSMMRALVTDDPRLVALAQASGALAENF